MFVIYLLGAAWFVLAAVGIIDQTTDDGRVFGPVVAVLAALAFSVISLAGWAVYKAKGWSRPLLLWLPVPLAIITSVLEYLLYESVGGIFLYYLPSYVLWILLLYLYLYRKKNVVAYFESRG